ncbi:MAG: quinolinate synthase NadA [Bacteroidales bacterium]|nr:quinolinate synthase NadA [Bacteroidales bacterium]
MDWVREIQKLKKERKAVILAHYYTRPEVQDVADCLGDSLALAQYAEKTGAEMIVFAGVHFMAETAKIMNPEKKVCIPDMGSRCSLADTCPADEFERFVGEHPDYKVISYINCSAAVKALSDVICTSGNARMIVESYPENEKLVFAPDGNLGGYLNRITGRKMLLWDGGCHVHALLGEGDYLEAKSAHPEAVLIAHPECNEKLLQHAAFIGSTTALVRYIGESDHPLYLIATEEGILHELNKKYPGKKLMIMKKKGHPDYCCAYMKKNTLEKIYACLSEGANELQMDADLMERARKPLLKMLSLSK